MLFREQWSQAKERTSMDNSISTGSWKSSIAVSRYEATCFKTTVCKEFPTLNAMSLSIPLIPECCLQSEVWRFIVYIPLVHSQRVNHFKWHRDVPHESGSGTEAKLSYFMYFTFIKGRRFCLHIAKLDEKKEDWKMSDKPNCWKSTNCTVLKSSVLLAVEMQQTKAHILFTYANGWQLSHPNSAM